MLERWNQACVMLALVCARDFARPALLMLGAAGCTHARLPARSRFGKGRWAKNFLAQSLSFK